MCNDARSHERKKNVVDSVIELLKEIKCASCWFFSRILMVIFAMPSVVNMG